MNRNQYSAPLAGKRLNLITQDMRALAEFFSTPLDLRKRQLRKRFRDIRRDNRRGSYSNHPGKVRRWVSDNLTCLGCGSERIRKPSRMNTGDANLAQAGRVPKSRNAACFNRNSFLGEDDITFQNRRLSQVGFLVL